MLCSGARRAFALAGPRRLAAYKLVPPTLSADPSKRRRPPYPFAHYASSGSLQPPPPPPPPPRPPPTSPSPADDDGRSQSIFQRFKNVAKKYWYILLPVHLVTSTVWFGSFYFIASSGIDVPALLESVGLPDWVVDKVRDGNSWTSYLLIAYGLYKIFTPLRYMVTLGGTGITIRYLQRLGYAIGSPKKQ